MNARLLDLRFGIVRALTVEMDGVSENPTRNVSKTLRLFQEIFGAVITNFINEISVRKAGLGDVRSVKNYFASIRDGGIGFIHSLSAGPEIAIHFWDNGKHATKRAINPLDVDFTG